MNKEPLINDAVEIGPDDQKVSRLLAALKRINAPNDFDFRVRARIASGSPVSRPAFGWQPAVRYSIPLILLVLVGAYFGFNALFADRHANAPVVADMPQVGAAPQIALPSSPGIVSPETSAPDERVAVKKPESLNSGHNDPRLKKVPSSDLASNQAGGGSMDEASKPGRKIYPRGFDPESHPPANTGVSGHDSSVPAKEILVLFGINGSSGQSGWKVESVTPDSLAGRSGVKAGDVIEAINDQALTDKTTFKGKFNGKTLRVRRDGASVQIVLKN